MNICFISLGHISKTRGGVDRVTDTLANAFIEKGHKVTMVSVWKAVEGDFIYPFQYFLPSQDIHSQENINFLTEFFISQRIDIIVNQSEPFALLKLIIDSRHDIPVVSVIHTDPCAAIKGIKDTWDKWKYDNGIVRFLIKSPYFWLRKCYQLYTRKKYIRDKCTFYYNHCDAVVLLSENFKQSFCKLAKLDTSEHLYAISNPMSFSKTIVSNKKEKIILYVGRLDFSPKRVDRLINAWKAVKHKDGWKVIVVGDGPAKTFYEDMCLKKGIDSIEFVGHTNPEPYYKKASIICITSTHEGFSLVAIEALQNEVIPIAFNSYEAVYDIIQNGVNGYIVEAFSIKQYSKTLERLIANQSLRTEIRENIRKQNSTGRKFDIETISTKWLELLSELTENASN